MSDESENMLVDSKIYLKSGIHIGTKFKTKYMANFIYKTRSDGLSVLNIQQIDERLRILGTFLSKYAPEDIMVVCRRESGWKPVKLFSKLTGVRVFAGRYPPGILTNPALASYTEIKAMVVVDAWPDRNAVLDAVKVGVPVAAFSDTNNQSNYIDLVVPCNNKGKKSLGLAFYLLTKGYMEKRGMTDVSTPFKHTVEDFTEA